MPTFVIERPIAGAGTLSGKELQAIAGQSCTVLRQLTGAQSLHSNVTDDRLCVYIAPAAAAVREHATRGGFPVDRVIRVQAIIDPTTSKRAGV